MEKYYKILSLKESATLEEVKQKYSELLKEFDPEKQEDDLKEFFKSEQEKVHEAFKNISEYIIEENTIETFKAEEEKEILFKNGKFDFEITKISRDSLDRMAYWAKFLAVIGYISFLIMIFFIFKIVSDDFPRFYYSDFIYENGYYFLIGSLIFFPSRYLERFSKMTREALNNDDKNKLALALQNLGLNFKFYGLFIILFLSFYLIILAADI